MVAAIVWGLVVGVADSGSELSQRVAEALARFGVAGDVLVSGGVAALQGSGPTVTVDVSAVLAEWPGLAEDARQRRVSEIARRLAAERRALTNAGPSRPGNGVPEWLVPVAKGAAGLVLLAGGWVGYRQWAGRAADAEKKPVIQDYDAYERERAERAARVCDATRSRVMRGAAVGPSDVEGWVVELWALRNAASGSLLADPALAQFVGQAKEQDKGRVVWPLAASLVGAEGPDTAAVLEEGNIPERGPATYRGLRLILTGRYVVPYFHETLRAEYLKFARALTDALGADYAALYARCADSTSHHLGSWFRGPTPGGGVTSLLYFRGTFNESPAARGSLLPPPGATGRDPAFAFKNLANATAALKKARVMSMIGMESGMISGADDRASTVTFPFRDSNRASRASHTIARDLGIGENR
jgi:hypothetical protein